jgi:ABC-type nitrate/sulfonate/bicarbonate transport system permease component
VTTHTRAADAEAVPFLQTRWSTPLLGAAGALIFIAIWEAAPRLSLVNASYLPPFTEVVPQIGQVVAGAGLREEFWRAVGMTMLGWAAGLAIALVLGVLLGVVIGSSRWIREYTGSTIEFLRPIPSVGLIPVAVVMFGVRPAATVFVVAWACFWVVLVHVIAGVADVDPIADATARSYGMSTLQRAAHVVWPTALPFLMTGLRLSATIALVVAITIEIVVGAPGIGQMIATYQSAGNVGVVYALAILAGVLGLVINLGMRRLESSALAWHSSVRQEATA